MQTKLNKSQATIIETLTSLGGAATREEISEAFWFGPDPHL